MTTTAATTSPTCSESPANPVPPVKSADALEREINRLIGRLREKLHELDRIRETDSRSCNLVGKTMHAVKVEALTKSLQRHRGNREEAASELGLARSTVFLKIKQWGIDVPTAQASWSRLSEEPSVHQKAAPTAVPHSIEDRADFRIDLPGKTWRQIEFEVLEKCLRRNGGNREATAHELDIARSTVFVRIKEWGINVPAPVHPSVATPRATEVPSTPQPAPSSPATTPVVE